MPTTRSKSSKEAFYAVAKGRRIGIFSTWAEAESLVKGFAGAKYKKFASLHEAQRFLGSGYENESVSLINPDAETNDYRDRNEREEEKKKMGTAVSSRVTASGEGFHNDSPASRSIKAISRRIHQNIPSSSGSCQSQREEENSPVSLTIWPSELHDEKKQFFQDEHLLLCMTDSNLYQVHSFCSDNAHSWFTSGYIFSASCNYFTKVDPILVCLRHFYRHALNQPVNLTQVFCDSPWLKCPYIESINWCIICDTDSSSESGPEITLKSQIKYRFNVDRSLNYLQDKVNKVTSLIKSGKIKCIDKSDETACTCAMEQLHPFLPEQLYTLLSKRVSSSPN